jgi:O-methyltransferase involved in polyketide biosynthesis
MNNCHGLPKPVLHHMLALGLNHGERKTAPSDSICAWFVKRFPAVQARMARQASLNRERTTALVIDRMLIDGIHEMQKHDHPIHVWTYGAGLDGRWLRLYRNLAGAIRHYHEVETPKLINLKDHALTESPFKLQWEEIDKKSSPVDSWGNETKNSGCHLIILEGLWSRLPLKNFTQLLGRFHRPSMPTQLLLDLPMGQSIHAPDSLSRSKLQTIGWTINEEIRLGPRSKRRGRKGECLCEGMEPMRALRLSNQNDWPN